MVLQMFQNHRRSGDDGGDDVNAASNCCSSSSSSSTATPTTTLLVPSNVDDDKPSVDLKSKKTKKTKVVNKKKFTFWQQAADEIADFQRLLANKERRKNFVDLMFMNQEEILKDLNNSNAVLTAKEMQQKGSTNTTSSKEINIKDNKDELLLQKDESILVRQPKKNTLLEVFVDGSSTDLEIEEEEEEEEDDEVVQSSRKKGQDNSKKSFLGMFGLRKKDRGQSASSSSSTAAEEDCTTLVVAKPQQHEENKKRNVWEEIHHDCTKGDKKILRAIGRTALVNSVVAATAFTGGAVTSVAGFATGGAITAKRFGDGLQDNNPLEVTKSLAVYGSATTASITGQAVAGTLMIAVAGATIPVAAAVAFGVGCTSGIAAGALSEWGVDYAYQTSVQQLSSGASHASTTKTLLMTEMKTPSSSSLPCDLGNANASRVGLPTTMPVSEPIVITTAKKQQQQEGTREATTR